MSRYFLEVAYLGTRYAGSQVQANAVTVQWELERALEIFLRRPVVLTGSSRTDTGVHAQQNFFHFDWEGEITPKNIYNINAILPPDITINGLFAVGPEAHCRFDAIAREYEYIIYRRKDPFLEGRALFYPYTIDRDALDRAAAVVMEYRDFTSFSKRNTQSKTFDCQVQESSWISRGDTLVYRVKANRFLRGMVRGLVGTILQAGRGKITVQEFREIIEARDCTRADFSVPGHGLFLMRVEYAENYFAAK
jgi:tRNA pseudouridine38-40 synthase